MPFKVFVIFIAVAVVCSMAKKDSQLEAYEIPPSTTVSTTGDYLNPGATKTIEKRSFIREEVLPVDATYNGNSWGAEVARSLAAAREAHDIVHAAYIQAKHAKNNALHHHSIAVAKEISALQEIKKNEEAAREARERAAEAQQMAIQAQTFYATARARAAAAQKIAAAREAAAAKALEFAVIEQTKRLRAKDVENAKKAALSSSENAGAISAAEYSARDIEKPWHKYRYGYPGPGPHIVLNGHNPNWPAL